MPGLVINALCLPLTGDTGAPAPGWWVIARLARMGHMTQADATVGRALRRLRLTAAVPDAPLVAGAALAFSATTELLVRGVPHGQNLATQLLLNVAATAPLAVARRYPAIVAGVISAAVLLAVVAVAPTVSGTIGLAAGHYISGRRSRPLVTVLLVLPFTGYAVGPYGWARSQQSLAVLLLVLVASAAALGMSLRAREQAAEQAASRAALRGTLLEHVARGERVRIARELHDVVAHHVSMIAFQAETARLTTPGMPAEGASRLADIADTARAALTEMRRVLGLLRTDDDADAELPRAPQPGLSELNELIDQARSVTGASTRLIVRGPVVDVGPGVQLTAYRIIQEALTNARRHAPGAAVDVVVDYTGTMLRLLVRDNGPGATGPDGSGHGLMGMSERAAMLGGRLRTGPAPGTGFLVEAVLPFGGGSG